MTRLLLRLMVCCISFTSSLVAQPLTWTHFTPAGAGPTAGQGSQSTVYDPTTDRLIVFGDFDVTKPCCVLSNNTWVLINASGSAGVPTWEQLAPDAPAGLPQARIAHSAVYDPTTNRMIIFGGGQPNGFAFNPLFNDVWVLTNANGLGGTPAWVPRSPSGGPPAPREGHGAFYKQATNEMIVFAGANNGILSVPNDLWSLQNANSIDVQPTWVQLSQTGDVPGPIEHFASAYDPTSDLWTIALGCCFYTNASRVLALNGPAGTPKWTSLSPGGTLPPPGDAQNFFYDRASNSLFVQTNGPGGWSNATWQLSGVNSAGLTPTWTNPVPLDASGSPPNRVNVVGSAYNPVTKQYIVPLTRTDALGNFVQEVWVLRSSSAPAPPQPTWTQKCSPPGPSHGYAAAMAYDSARMQVVLFGGVDLTTNTTSDETWVWDGTNWTQQFPTTKSAPRGSHAMAYDAGNRQVVMFGGAVGGAISNDTWVWDGTNWTQKFPAASPSPRLHTAMVYDPGLQRILLIGGSDGSPNTFAETWAWDGTNWSMLAAPPIGRSNFSAAYDPIRHQTVVFGGRNTGGYLGDTEVFDGTTWKPLSPISSPPIPRQDDRLVFDEVLGKVVLFGGAGPLNTPAYTDTWTWDGASWTQQFPLASPQPGRSLDSMAYDSARSQVVMFGGVNNSGSLSDTWVYGTPTIAGCQSQTGTIQVSTNLASAFFNISGPQTFFGSGTNAIFTNVPIGDYTITFGSLAGFIAPAPQTESLSSGGTINFSGNYQSSLTAPSFRIVAVNVQDDPRSIQRIEIPASGGDPSGSLAFLLGESFSVRLVAIKPDGSDGASVDNAIQVATQTLQNPSSITSEFYSHPSMLFPNSVLLQFTDPKPTQFFPVHSGSALLSLTFNSGSGQNTVHVRVQIDACRTSPCSFTVNRTLQPLTVEFDDLMIQFGDLRGIPIEVVKAQVLQEAGMRPDKGAFRYEPLAVDFRSNFTRATKVNGQTVFTFSQSLQRAPRLQARYAPYVFQTLDNTADGNLPQGASLMGNGPNVNSGDDATPRHIYQVTIGNRNCPVAGLAAADCPLRELLAIDTASGRAISSQDQFLSMENILYSNPGQKWLTIDPGPALARTFQNARAGFPPFTAQSAIASSYGLTQVLYTTAVDAINFTEHGIGIPPHRMFEPKASLDLGTEYLSILFKNSKGGKSLSDTPSFRDMADLFFKLGVSLKPYNGGMITEQELRSGCDLSSGPIAASVDATLHAKVLYPCTIIVRANQLFPVRNASANGSAQ